MGKPLRGKICTTGVDTEFCFTMMRKTLKLILKIAGTVNKRRNQSGLNLPATCMKAMYRQGSQIW
ncbi:hypothetical protein DPE14_23525 [Salmonella enterica subsp. enterica]|uniref:Uncharacterized protein n=1 Tax=Salmonella enterica subsp. enterica serovar London TaxID=149390 RepID=A0A5W2Z3U9_SALET|nr:hypothetical protein [Salmonella enterica subsp. enterica serovar Bredeney]EAA4401789.1 hypothetical protein [Salmonella enterica subsp. enterica serovar London]EAA7353901.1 hypothetical protein [Salmonella enterica subsp. enterica]EAB7892643.1 hypothetical protein [Salmonella enterica subsp. enterica serovar Newport]EAP2626220.1 hypothetical protein [Salmonella enterica]EBW5413438.1 hypothetical protein [Salmonella enterica subsp. enterica serovar Bonn]EBY7414763.1 hypothetical protein [S